MKIFKSIGLFLTAPLLALAMFCVIFQIWKIDLSQPVFGYSDDALFMFFIAKDIVDSGWIFYNNLIGLPGKFSLNDFPLHADNLNLLLLKFFAQFTKNPFLIINCFFVVTFPIIAASAFVVLRSFKISYFVALLFALLYAFSPYHFVRGTYHLFIANYAIVPLLVMVAVWLMNGKIQILIRNHKRMITLSAEGNFPVFLILAIASVSGIYYIFFASIIFIFIWLLEGLKTGKFFTLKSLSAPIMLGFVMMMLIYVNLPTLTYWLQNGQGNLLNRGLEESRRYALSIVNLLLPISNHYFDSFAHFRGIFDKIATEGESNAESLGIIGSLGFLFLIFWIICGNFKNENSVFNKVLKKFSLSEKDQNFISNLASINIFLVLFFTVSGFVMLLSAFMPIFRSHARISIFICFIALSVVAFLSDKLLQKKLSSGKKLPIFVAAFLCLGIFILGIFDQVGEINKLYYSQDRKTFPYESPSQKFDSDKKFISKIEESLPENSAVFILPIHAFPEADAYQLLIPYLHSKHLRWSYPTISRREVYSWQKQNFDKKSSKEFISEIKEAGFSAIVINHDECKYSNDCKALEKFEAELKKSAGRHSIISEKGDLIFYKI